MKNDSNDILREMSKINWADIPPGIDCISVPRDFAKFAADDSDEREQAYACFDNRIVIQGTLYESAFYITPFLIELLRRRTAANLPCEAIYDLLYQIVEGSFHGCGAMVECDIVTQPFVYYIPKKGGTLLPLSNACRDAVLAGWEVYRADLMNPRALESNNAFALDLVSLFRDHILLKRTVLQQTAEARAHSTIGQTARKQLQEIDSPDSAQNILEWTNRVKAEFLLAIAEGLLAGIGPHDEKYDLVRAALRQCHRWVNGEPLSGDELYHAIGTDLPDLSASLPRGLTTHSSVKYAREAIIGAIFFTVWSAYDRESAKERPACLADFDESAVIAVTNSAIRSGLVTAAQVEHLMNVTRLINLLAYEDRYITGIELNRENLSLTLHINLLSRTACGISKNPYKLESIWERLHEKDIPNGIIRFEGVTEIKKSSDDFELNDEIYCITITGLLGGAAAYEWKIDGACVTDSGSIVNGYYLVQATDICLIDPRAPETRIIW